METPWRCFSSKGHIQGIFSPRENDADKAFLEEVLGALKAGEGDSEDKRNSSRGWKRATEVAKRVERSRQTFKRAESEVRNSEERHQI